MSPGMANTAATICDKAGHIMSYGDGWYGGVYVAALYASAFVYDDITTIVTEALKVIPGESDYSKCLHDVITWCRENDDWRHTWRLVNDKWADETGCPQGVHAPFSIDAKLNSAYVVMGLLYGNGDMERTLDIATRCGSDGAWEIRRKDTDTYSVLASGTVSFGHSQLRTKPVDHPCSGDAGRHLQGLHRRL